LRQAPAARSLLDFTYAVYKSNKEAFF